MAKGGQGPSPGGRQTTSLVPRLSHCPVFDRLQYGKTEGEGPFYKVSDVSVYLGRQREEEFRIERMHFAHTFFVLNLEW